MRKPAATSLLPRVFLALFCFAWLSSAGPMRAVEIIKGLPACAVCKKAIEVKGWRYGEALVCDPCHQLPARCTICRLPALPGYSTTSDGRVICAVDATNAVLDLELARSIFQDARADLLRLTRGRLELRFPEVTVNLFDVDYWNHQDGKEVNALHKTGFSQSRVIGDRYIHSVLLLSGQTKAATASVCAHEYMHLWINENLDRSRNVEHETVEALCELLAHELMSERRLAAETENIRHNPYTKGRILGALDLRNRIGLPAVLDWVQTGTGRVLDGGELVQVRDEAILASMRSLPQPLPATAPEKLALKGLSGAKDRRFALINNRTFEKGEQGTVRVGDDKVRVICLDIGDDSVVIRVDGEKEPVTLNLAK